MTNRRVDIGPNPTSLVRPVRNDALVITHSQTAVYAPPSGVVQSPTDFAPIYVPHEALVQRHLVLEARVEELERRASNNPEGVGLSTMVKPCAIRTKRHRGKKNGNAR